MAMEVEKAGAALRDQVQMWALGEADLLVATHGSAFASAGRSLGWRGRGGEGRAGVTSGPSSYVVAREGSCFPWPDALGGGPMTAAGSQFEDSSCWSERRHRRFSWAAGPPRRPPRLVPA